MGYDKHDPLGRNGANSRNGIRTKTVLTDTDGGALLTSADDLEELIASTPRLTH